MSHSVHTLDALIGSRRLTPIQRRIAHRLLAAGSAATHLSSSELAALAEVSQPSVSRFVKALGFANYAEFSQFLRHSGHAGENHALAGDFQDGNIYQHAVSAEIINLNRLRESFAAPETLRSIATALADSAPLVIVGLRASAGLAHTLGYFASIVLRDVRVFTHFDSATQDCLEQARMAGASWIVVLALPRYPAEIVRIAEYAKTLGLRVLAITDSAVSPLTALADETLLAPVGNQLVFDSHVVPTMVCMALLEAITEMRPSQTQHRLEAFEESVAERKVFTGP